VIWNVILQEQELTRQLQESFPDDLHDKEGDRPEPKSSSAMIMSHAKSPSGESHQSPTSPSKRLHKIFNRTTENERSFDM